MLTPEQVRSLGPIYANVLTKYTFVNVRGEFVLCWDLARYINHSCDPTCLSAGYNFEVAVRDIHPGEELTDDYATLNLEGSFECHCGTANAVPLFTKRTFTPTPIAGMSLYETPSRSLPAVDSHSGHS